MTSKCYSYLRFSSPKQAAGNSKSRQLDYARRWAADNGFEFDESLTMKDEGLAAARGEVLQQIADNEAKLQKLADAAMDDDLPKVLLDRLRNLESEIAHGKQRAAILEAELRAADTHTPPDAKKWLELRAGVLGLDNQARLDARRLVLDTFSEIQIFNRGVYAGSKDTIDVCLVAKSGDRRLLSISRKSGNTVFAGKFEDMPAPVGIAVVKASILQPAT